MVDDPNTDDLIHWSDDGTTFIVPHQSRFSEELLPRFFKHNRFQSFVRQLNMYGFGKVPHLQQGALKADGQEGEIWEFRNDNFLRDHPELLLQMQRKKGVRHGTDKGKGREGEEDESSALDSYQGALTRTQRNDGEVNNLQMASVWNAIQAIQQAQNSINDNLRHLHNSNAELYREAAEQRARNKKQEETINKMLRFLAGVFGAQDMDSIGSGERRSTSGAAAGGDNGNRNNRAFLRPFQGNRNRLMIGDGSNENEGIELPIDESDNIFEDLTPEGRITEERSASNSPKETGSPERRFQSLPSTSGTKSLPSVSSAIATTPGGGRRISQDAGAQILQAITSGEANKWIATHFGQQNVGSSGQSPATRNDNLESANRGDSTYKLDAQTLAVLQAILSGQSTETGQNANGYFDPMSPTNTAAVSSSQQPWSNNAYNSQVSKLGRSQHNLQNTTQDASAIQNAVDSLVQGVQNVPTAQQQPPQTSSNEPKPSVVTAHSEPPQPSSDIDMDSFLKEFLVAPPGSASPSPSNGTFDGLGIDQSPDFAFSPAAKVQQNESTSPDRTVSAEASDSQATNTPLDSPSLSNVRKRKPPFEFQTSADSEVARGHIKAKPSGQQGF